MKIWKGVKNVANYYLQHREVLEACVPALREFIRENHLLAYGDDWRKYDEFIPIVNSKTGEVLIKEKIRIEEEERFLREIHEEVVGRSFPIALPTFFPPRDYKDHWEGKRIACVWDHEEDFPNLTGLAVDYFLPYKFDGNYWEIILYFSPIYEDRNLQLVKDDLRCYFADANFRILATIQALRIEMMWYLGLISKEEYESMQLHSRLLEKYFGLAFTEFVYSPSWWELMKLINDRFGAGEDSFAFATNLKTIFKDNEYTKFVAEFPVKITVYGPDCIVFPIRNEEVVVTEKFPETIPKPEELKAYFTDEIEDRRTRDPDYDGEYEELILSAYEFIYEQFMNLGK